MGLLSAAHQSGNPGSIYSNSAGVLGSPYHIWFKFSLANVSLMCYRSSKKSQEFVSFSVHYPIALPVFYSFFVITLQDLWSISSIYLSSMRGKLFVQLISWGEAYFNLNVFDSRSFYVILTRFATVGKISLNFTARVGSVAGLPVLVLGVHL